MTTFELDYRKFELPTYRNQLPTLLQATIEEVFENLETLDVDMSTSHSNIEPIFNRNFGNTFHHQNGKN